MDRVSGFVLTCCARLHLNKRPLCVSIQLSALALLLGSLMPASAAVFAQPAEGESSLELETCELTVPGTPLSTVAECGWLEVAENPDEPEGRKIQLRIARVPARGRTTEPDPLIFFAGGPGQAATEGLADRRRCAQ